MNIKKLIFSVLVAVSLLCGIAMLFFGIKNRGAEESGMLIMCGTLFTVVPLGMILGGLVASGHIGIDKIKMVDIAVGGILVLVGAEIIWLFGKSLSIFIFIPVLFVVLGGAKIITTLLPGKQENEE